MVLSSSKDKWIHSEDTIINGKATYHVKFVGVTEVSEPRGMEVVREAMQKLKFSRHIRRSEGNKPPKVDLHVNVNGMKLYDQRTKTLLHDIPLHRVSFCADDKQDKRLFSFIAKSPEGKHYCYGLDSLRQANDITLTIGQAFELAYQRFLNNDKASSSKQVIEMSRRIELLEKENSELKGRINQLESPTRTPVDGGINQLPTSTPEQPSPVDGDQSHPVKQSKPPPIPLKDAFDMNPFTPPNLVKLPSPKQVHPRRLSTRARTTSTKSDDLVPHLFGHGRPQADVFPTSQEGLSSRETAFHPFDPLKANK